MKVAISKNDPVNAVEDVTVNGVLISEDQISREAQNHPGPHWKAACDAATRALVIKELLLQEARSGNVCKDAASKALEGDEQDEEALIEALIQSNVQVPVAEQDECHRYYCNNPGKFNSGPSFQARHILIRIASDASDDVNRANRKAKQIIEQLNKSPERFAEFSSLHSACPSSESGGDLGKIGRGSTAPEFEHALCSFAKRRVKLNVALISVVGRGVELCVVWLAHRSLSGFRLSTWRSCLIGYGLRRM